MISGVDIGALVWPLCPSLLYASLSATAMQWQEIYHLPLGFVKQYHSLCHSPSYYPSIRPLHFPSPSLSPSFCPFCPQLQSHSLSHPLFPSLSQFLSYRPACPPHPCSRHCHYLSQDGSVHCSVLCQPLNPHHHHCRRVSHPNWVIYQPGSHMACTAHRLAAQSSPWDYCYRIRSNDCRCVERLASWLSAKYCTQLDPHWHKCGPTSNCLFVHGFGQTFSLYRSGRLRNTPEMSNTCSRSTATAGGIVKSVRPGLCRVHHHVAVG